MTLRTMKKEKFTIAHPSPAPNANTSGHQTSLPAANDHRIASQGETSGSPFEELANTANEPTTAGESSEYRR
jgi:hypothetical protein